MRHLFKESTKKGFPNETLLVASQKDGVVSKDAYGKRTVEAIKDLHNLKLVEQGDFVISLRSFQGGIELAYERGIISPAYTIMKETRQIEKRYFKNLFKSPPFISLMTLCVKGIREGQNIDYPTFKNEYLPLPPIEEQRAIATYLDKKNSEIDKFIRNKERLVELLEERKKHVITNTIFQEENPVKPLKYLVSKVGSGVTPLGGASVYISVGISFLRSQNIHFDGLRLDDVAFISDKIHTKMKSTKVILNDVLLNITGASIGRCCVMENEMEANVNQHVCIIRPKKVLNSKYLAYYMASTTIQNLIRNSQDGASREGLSFSEIKSFPVPIISIEKQVEIINHIKEIEIDLNLAISKAQKEISSIKEYREALITDLVTGKRSV